MYFDTARIVADQLRNRMQRFMQYCNIREEVAPNDLSLGIVVLYTHRKFMQQALQLK